MKKKHVMNMREYSLMTTSTQVQARIYTGSRRLVDSYISLQFYKNLPLLRQWYSLFILVMFILIVVHMLNISRLSQLLLHNYLFCHFLNSVIGIWFILWLQLIIIRLIIICLQSSNIAKLEIFNFSYNFSI